jgi:hypothetical protein
MKTPKAVRDAMARLRELSGKRTVLDSVSRVLYEGKPDPVDVEKELTRVYFAGMRKAVSMVVKADQWTPVIHSVRAEIRRIEKEAKGA